MDFYSTRVDNGWLIFCLSVSLVTQFMGKGQNTFISWICGLFLPFLLLGWLFIFRMLGPGDIKLLCVIGSILGPDRVLECIIISFLIGAGISAAILISNGNIRQRFLYLFQYIVKFLKTGERKAYYKSGMTLENFHFTVPIFLSALLYAGGVY